MTPRELIRQTSDVLRAAGIPDPENDASLLLSHLMGRSPLELRLDSETETDPDVVAVFCHLSEKRLSRIPLQYILGKAPFYRRLYTVDPRVLIPRPETEMLCEWALEAIKNVSSPRILDLCCGSGCIGLTLKAERPDALVTLSDLSVDALNVSAENAANLSLDVLILQSDLLQNLHGFSFDLIVSNPPYIPSGECESLQPEVRYEPILALDGGPDGCDIYRKIIRDAGLVLVPGGRLLMEMGINESLLLSALLSKHGFSSVEIRQDYSGIDRMILAILP